MNDALGMRMKEYYETRSRTSLIRRMPVIIRLDGKAFHTFTKGMNKPFDDLFVRTMQHTAVALCKQIQGCKLAYIQSDEISLLLTDWDTLDTQAWFGYEVQKMVSVSASIATLYFNQVFSELYSSVENKSLYQDKLWRALFDSRAFNVPKEDVVNYFWWRQADAIRNSTLSIAQSKFSHTEMQGKSVAELTRMLIFTDSNVYNFHTHYRRGTVILKDNRNSDRGSWRMDLEIPIFHENRNYIERFING